MGGPASRSPLSVRMGSDAASAILHPPIAISINDLARCQPVAAKVSNVVATSKLASQSARDPVSKPTEATPFAFIVQIGLCNLVGIRKFVLVDQPTDYLISVRSKACTGIGQRRILD